MSPASSLVGSECLNASPVSPLASRTRESLSTLILDLPLIIFFLFIKGSMQAMVHVHQSCDARHRVHGHLRTFFDINKSSDPHYEWAELINQIFTIDAHLFTKLPTFGCSFSPNQPCNLLEFPEFTKYVIYSTS